MEIDFNVAPPSKCVDSANTDCGDALTSTEVSNKLKAQKLTINGEELSIEGDVTSTAPAGACKDQDGSACKSKYEPTVRAALTNNDKNKMCSGIEAYRKCLEDASCFKADFKADFKAIRQQYKDKYNEAPKNCGAEEASGAKTGLIVGIIIVVVALLGGAVVVFLVLRNRSARGPAAKGGISDVDL